MKLSIRGGTEKGTRKMAARKGCTKKGQETAGKKRGQ